VEVEGELKEGLPWKPGEVYWADWVCPAPRGYRGSDGGWIDEVRGED